MLPTEIHWIQLDPHEHHKMPPLIEATSYILIHQFNRHLTFLNYYLTIGTINFLTS